MLSRNTATLPLEPQPALSLRRLCLLRPCGTHQGPCCRQHVIPAYMTVQRVEPKLRFPLGLLASFCLREERLGVMPSSGFTASSVVVSPIGIPPFLPKHVFSRSLRSTGISRFFATMNPSDSQCSHMAVMFSHHLLATLPPPHRVSRFLDSSFRTALSPLTPGGPMAASARCFTIGGGFTTFRRAGHPHRCNEAGSGSLALRLARSLGEASTFGLLRGRPLRYLLNEH